jgi:hypothetical protein
MLKLSKANGKLVKFIDTAKRHFPNLKLSEIVSFGLPAYENEAGERVCYGAGICAAICYARQGTYRFKTSREVREDNFSACKVALANFGVDRLVSMLSKMIQNQAPNVRILRIHDSGDFFSQAYLDAWNLVCTRFPEIAFYAYTKEFDLNFEEKPRNFSIVQSEGSRWDHLIDLKKPHARIFPDAASRRSAGYIDGDSSDLPAIVGSLKIGFVYHGGRNLTPSQIITLKKGN